MAKSTPENKDPVKPSFEQALAELERTAAEVRLFGSYPAVEAGIVT